MTRQNQGGKFLDPIMSPKYLELSIVYFVQYDAMLQQVIVCIVCVGNDAQYSTTTYQASNHAKVHLQ